MAFSYNMVSLQVAPHAVHTKAPIVQTPQELYDWLANVVIPVNTKQYPDSSYPIYDDDFYQLGPVRLKLIRHRPRKIQ